MNARGGLPRDARKWSYLISQNPFSTEIFRRAFAYDGPILEVGYPRNDILLNADAESTRQRTRRALGIAAEAPVVLYAPTWRDTHVDTAGRPEHQLSLDLSSVAKALGDDATVLLRLHYLLDPGSAGALATAGALNVSTYRDIRDLYLACDVLVTDYSSAMFDFAVTGKPIVFYTPDLTDYRDSVRGFYFELADEAPGPLCADIAELVSALSGLPAVQRSFSAKYAAFRAKFCPWDDGHAAARTVDAVMG